MTACTTIKSPDKINFFFPWLEFFSLLNQWWRQIFKFDFLLSVSWRKKRKTNFRILGTTLDIKVFCHNIYPLSWEKSKAMIWPLIDEGAISKLPFFSLQIRYKKAIYAISNHFCFAFLLIKRIILSSSVMTLKNLQLWIQTQRQELNGRKMLIWPSLNQMS